MPTSFPASAAADILISVADVAAILGIPDDGARALAEAGHFAGIGDVECLAERIWRAALPTARDACGVRLTDAVEATGAGPTLWPAVIAALLDGRLNAYRRRGAFGAPVLAALVVSSEQVVAALAPDAAAPFIWTPTPGG